MHGRAGRGSCLLKEMAVPNRRTVPLPRAAAGRDNRSRWMLRGGACAAACLAACVAPAAATAHGRAATVALDYRLPIDPGLGRLSGVEAHVVDGDRPLQLAVARGARVVVFGDLGEPMLRFADGVWVNQSSPTAQANRAFTAGLVSLIGVLAMDARDEVEAR
jgi:hypothetical protein